MASPEERQFTELKAEIAKNHGNSARKFARTAELDKSLVNKLLNGRMRRWDPAVVSKIARATQDRVNLDAFAAYAERLSRADAESGPALVAA